MGLICSPERKVCDMGYYFRGENTDTIKTRKQIQKEQQEIRQFDNKIRKQIAHMSINDYGIIRDNIREFGTLENVNLFQIQELNELLLDGLKDLATNATNIQAELKADIEKIESERYHEDPRTLESLKLESERKMYDYYLRLRQNRTKEGVHVNKRLIGNWVKQATQAEALALSRLSLIDEYKNLFTEKQLEALIPKTKSIMQSTFEQKQKKDIEQKQKELSSVFMTRFKCDKAIKQMETVCFGSNYFGGGSSE